MKYLKNMTTADVLLGVGFAMVMYIVLLFGLLLFGI